MRIINNAFSEKWIILENEDNCGVKEAAYFL